MQTTLKDLNLSDFLLLLFEKMRQKNIAKISGRTKLQKLVFILTREFELPKNFKYFLYTYGPYSSLLQNEIDGLITFNLMEGNALRQDDYIIYEYKLTRKGILIAQQILNEITPATREMLDKIADHAVQLNKMALKDLINNAYEHFNGR